MFGRFSLVLCVFMLIRIFLNLVVICCWWCGFWLFWRNVLVFV